MKNVFKRFSYILLSCYMVFCPVASASIQVQAFEWVEPSLSFAESLGYLLSLLGIAYVGDKATNWEGWNDSGIASDYADEFQQYALEHGLNYEETTSWMNEVGNGRLNQVSQVWEKFKAWASSLVNNGSSGDTSGFVLSMVQSVLPNIISISGLPDDFSFDYAYYYKDGNNYMFYFFSNFSHSYNSLGSLKFNIIDDSSSVYYNPAYVNGNSISMEFTRTYSESVRSITESQASTGKFFVAGVSDLPSYFNVWDYTSNPSESVFVSLSPDSINDFSLALQTAISDAIPGVIPLPWDNVGDNTQAINDKMDSLLEQVNAGTLSIDAFMEAVQTLLGVFTVDTTADGVLIPEKPNPDTDEPQKLEDEVAKNKSNSGFMLGGLEKVFPFCIPFDLYAFMTLLVAEPVAPVIHYPIYNPVTDSNEEITIDFSTWESVVVIFRYIFDFLFIIGLLLIARALIGEGSDA